jgi:hypothetical protein
VVVAVVVLTGVRMDQTPVTKQVVMEAITGSTSVGEPPRLQGVRKVAAVAGATVVPPQKVSSPVEPVAQVNRYGPRPLHLSSVPAPAVAGVAEEVVPSRPQMARVVMAGTTVVAVVAVVATPAPAVVMALMASLC